MSIIYSPVFFVKDTKWYLSVKNRKGVPEIRFKTKNYRTKIYARWHFFFSRWDFPWWVCKAFFANLAGVVRFKSEIKKAEVLRKTKEQKLSQSTQNQNIFSWSCYSLGFFKSYVHFLFRGVAGTCSGNQGCWWIQPRLSLPGVEWLYLLFHTAVCTDSLVGPGSGKDQSKKKSVEPTIDTSIYTILVLEITG